jgi:hypothetical protein
VSQPPSYFLTEIIFIRNLGEKHVVADVFLTIELSIPTAPASPAIAESFRMLMKNPIKKERNQRLVTISVTTMRYSLSLRCGSANLTSCSMPSGYDVPDSAGVPVCMSVARLLITGKFT